MNDAAAAPSSESQPGGSAFRSAWRFLRYPLAAYLVAVVAMTLLETWLVYPAPPKNDGDWHPAGLNQEDVSFTSADGTKLHGWFVPHPLAKRAILFCHGNGEQVSYNADLISYLRDRFNASVFIFDYRGYGRSAGSPTEAGCIADGLAADRWLANRLGVPTNEIVVMGRSLGGAVAVAVAAEQGAKALILENTFSRMTDVAAFHYPWLPIRLVMRNRYDSLARIRDYHGPVLQSHGATDTIVPIQFARQLFAVIPTDQKQFVEFADTGHNDPPHASFDRTLADFLDRFAPELPPKRMSDAQ